MAIKKEFLHLQAAVEENYIAGDYIFRQNEMPLFYYQILNGTIKLTNVGDNGEEFIHNILSSNSCFGEAMLLLERPYPVNAVALSNCSILKITRVELLELMAKYPRVALDVCLELSDKAYNKYVMMYKITNNNAIDRLVELMDVMKESQENKDKFSFEIPYTRKQLGSLTSLRTETVIRAIKKMEQNKTVLINNRKIFY
ncbi:Crp/Fnr family transcriptional regulator [Chryseobacterium indoltheticum]|uniref:Crp/Fnr family transcriptional regulator n=1 Tax=Chryseobacterium indoltheticum TaxID=254 RepID=UPI0019147540|nr:Crp/Fnr family transcriptional regulator [Chryseobacterium indoltheticum]QQQ29126.1 Crp/Fnr family transcriptional regulator [Chryseobacterium indoltheticum]